MNVRGKRGNIVQVYPAVEYDFVPTSLRMSPNDLVHVQWTGSNTHLNQQPEGDGQAGNDGQGREGTDRHNLVQINNMNENFPLPFEIGSMWSSGDVELVAYLNSINFTDDSSLYLTEKASLNSVNFSKDLALYLASGGYYKCVESKTCNSASYEKLSTTAPLDEDINASPASLPGVLLKFKRSNISYFFMCSRNNNFSNRSQKGVIIVN